MKDSQAPDWIRLMVIEFHKETLCKILKGCKADARIKDDDTGEIYVLRGDLLSEKIGIIPFEYWERIQPGSIEKQDEIFSLVDTIRESEEVLRWLPSRGEDTASHAKRIGEMIQRKVSDEGGESFKLEYVKTPKVVKFAVK